MYKRIGLISILLILAVWAIVFFSFSDKITAEIPSASSYVLNHKDLTVHFSESMDPTTFTDDTVIVKTKSGEKITVEMEWNDTFTILTLKAPDKGYETDEEYNISILKDVKTASGENLSKTFTHNFTAVAELPKIKDNKQLLTLLKERMEQNSNEKNSLFETSESADMDSGDDSAASGGGGGETSDTNIQVEGIDEADMIKTDGKSIFFVRDGDILITSTEKENSKLLSQIKVENFYPFEIYLHDNLLISIGQKSEPLRVEKDSEHDSDRIEMIIPEIYHGQTTVMLYDIKDPSNPKQIREVSLEGHYNSSRILDGYLYLIANQHPPYQILTEEEDMEVRPFIKDTAVSDESMPVDFDKMYFFPESKENQFLLLTSIDLKDMNKEANIETYLGASSQIYMSQNNLYIAIEKFKEIEESAESEVETNDTAVDMMIWLPRDVDTEITQFLIDSGKITYNASTLVNGTLINQFAMDERLDHFRVATTKGNTWDEEQLSTNNLYTFDMNLEPLGKIEGLAEGERIYSVRFMEDIAYIVTFKEVDPLFVIDLKDPTKPTVLGELKIPGFSNYLHPLDDNHVIGFGQDTKLVKEEGMKEPIVRTDGIKISVFDVSDPTNPIEKFTEVIGQSGSYSELLHNHKVLFKHPSKNIYGFPANLSETKKVVKDDITYEEWNVIFEGVLLYEIDAENGIKLVDTITHQGEFEEYPEWTSEIKRLVSVDDTIYTFSWDQMKVYDMNEKQILKTVQLPELIFNY
ncbi:beta-propeller domain-containing protein [Ornithinibacillus halotolerans]|uniref:SbsA Ig-like domain-containing protein n=1 Tax=Ornithinibacillus halotolerans TaxID=1274357 RepID=A0A916RWN6_9BACI|nr:beta-propeller domain-containing protein [Ornithinibacillus halotolerans]GGA73843.1 hypothetical protein GCM10008025_16930 [Ornithinibacillus halotolerans]